MASICLSVKAPYIPADLAALQQSLGVDQTSKNSEGSGFQAERFQAALTTGRVGHVLVHAAELSSTQDLLKKHQSILDDGTTCVALRQTAGRGRRDNRWESPIGCLMFSIYSKLELNPALSPFLNYVVCLAITRGIEKLSSEKLSGHSIDFKIKWPNDIYYKGQKLGGVLLQSSFRGNTLHLITGVGLNVLNPQPTICISDIFKEHILRHGLEEMADPVTLEDSLDFILNEFEPLMDHLVEKGFDEYLKKEYLNHWIHTDQKLQCESSTVTIKGIASSGFLQAQTASGETVELFPDGNTIDMLQGLIIRRST